MTKHFLPTLFGTFPIRRPALNSLHREFDRMFDELRERFPALSGDDEADDNGFLVPKLDVKETDSQITISAEIPGVEEADIDVTAEDNVLTLTAEKKTDRDEEEEGYRLIERSYGKFMRTIPLSFEIDAEKVQADFKNGVLSIGIQKPPEAETKAQKIPLSKAA
ncbi:MAG: Hsp20 family protein [Rhizobiaceae bacterium]